MKLILAISLPKVNIDNVQSRMIQRFYYQQKNDFTHIKGTYSQARKILYFLIALDLLFVLLHLYSLSIPLTDEVKSLRLDMDLGYAEIFQYLKFVALAIVLLLIFLERKLWVFICWSFFFLFLFADDAFSFHEIIGAKIVSIFRIPNMFGLRGQDFGELAFVGLIALFFLCFFLYSILKGPEKSRKVTVHFFFLMAILVFFGVFVDLLHSFLIDMPGSGILTIIEDSGEMFATSLLLYYGIWLYLENKYNITHQTSIK